MAEHKSMLCIGGPRAGERYAVQSGAGFCVPVKLEASFLPPNEPVQAEFTNYRSEVFHTPQGDVSFWVPAGQTPLETITLLLESYEQSAIRGRKNRLNL